MFVYETERGAEKVCIKAKMSSSVCCIKKAEFVLLFWRGFFLTLQRLVLTKAFKYV